MSFNCKDCKERFVGCHAVCESYLKFQAERKLIRENRFKMSSYLDYARQGQTKQIRYSLNHR